MHSIIRTLILAVTLAAVPYMAQAQQAQDADPVRRVKVGMINLEEIARKSTAVQNIREQIDAYTKEIRDDVKAEEETLVKARDDLSKKRTMLSQDAFAEESKRYQDKVNAFQRKVQSKREALAQSQGEAMVQVLKVRDEVIKDVVVAKDLALLLRSEAVIIAIPEMDITDEVLGELNKRLSSVKVSPPSQFMAKSGQ